MKALKPTITHMGVYDDDGFKLFDVVDYQENGEELEVTIPLQQAAGVNPSQTILRVRLYRPGDLEIMFNRVFIQAVSTIVNDDIARLRFIMVKV